MLHCRFVLLQIDLAVVQDVPIACNLLICSISDKGQPSAFILSFHAQAWTVQPFANVFHQT